VDDPDPSAAVIARAAANLRRTRRHATWLERIAVALLTFTAAIAVVLAATDPAWIGYSVGATWCAVIGWGVLRALALVLHLRVDQSMLALADDDGEPAGAAR
jgi:hypothetical protein